MDRYRDHRVPRSGTGRGSGLTDASTGGNGRQGSTDGLRTAPVEGLASCGGPRPLASSPGAGPSQDTGTRRRSGRPVQEHLPETGHSVTIRRRRHPAWRSLPQEVASLTVVRRKSISKDSWTTVRPAFVPTLTPLKLQQTMRNKEAKVPSYRQQCGEVWLLVVARGLEPSTFGDLGPEVEGYRFESGFDRVYFLHYFDGSVSELHVRRVI